MTDPGQAIAEQIVADLLAGDFSKSFEASVPDNPARIVNVDGKNAVTPGLQVFVWPVSEVETNVGNNSAVDERVEVYVAVSRLVKGSRRKELGNFVRELRVALRLQPLDLDLGDGSRRWYWDSSETITKYDPEQLATPNRFYSVFSEVYYKPT